MTAHPVGKGPCASCRCPAQPLERSSTDLLRHSSLHGEACQLGPKRLRIQPRRERVEGRDLVSRLAKPAIGSAGRPQARATRATTATRRRARQAAAPRRVPARQADIDGTVQAVARGRDLGTDRCAARLAMNLRCLPLHDGPRCRFWAKSTISRPTAVGPLQASQRDAWERTSVVCMTPPRSTMFVDAIHRPVVVSKYASSGGVDGCRCQEAAASSMQPLSGHFD